MNLPRHEFPVKQILYDPEGEEYEPAPYGPGGDRLALEYHYAHTLGAECIEDPDIRELFESEVRRGWHGKVSKPRMLWEYKHTTLDMLSRLDRARVFRLILTTDLSSRHITHRLRLAPFRQWGSKARVADPAAAVFKCLREGVERLALTRSEAAILGCILRGSRRIPGNRPQRVAKRLNKQNLSTFTRQRVKWVLQKKFNLFCTLSSAPLYEILTVRARNAYATKVLPDNYLEAHVKAHLHKVRGQILSLRRPTTLLPKYHPDTGEVIHDLFRGKYFRRTSTKPGLFFYSEEWLT